MLSKYGVARHIFIPVVKRAVVDFAVGADWTPAAGDVKISKDGGAAANVTNLPVAIAMGNTAIWDFSLTATEMQAALVVVTVADSATKVVEDQAFIIETYGHASGQHEFDLDTAASAMGIASVSGAVGSVTGSVGSVTGAVGSVSTGGVTAATFAAGAIDAGAIATDAFGALELAAGAATEIADAVWATAMVEPTAPPAVTGTLKAAIAWLLARDRNKLTQTATTTTLRNDADTVTVATSTVSDDGTTFVRSEWV